MITKEQVLEALSYVEDPDLKKDLVTLGMIKDVQIEGSKVSFTVELTTPACPMKEMIERACRNAILHYVDQKAEVEIKMTARVNTSKTSKNSVLPNVKNIIAVASGKGGVGKSTVAANLAVALAKKGAKVGLLDADIYGPSAPILFALKNERPYIKEENGRNLMIPIEQYGVKVLSIGFLVDEDKAIAWRGPMAAKALQQLFMDAEWGELDYLLVDLPPGTGDIHLTLVATVPLSGAVVVTTPQQVALADAVKGISMFQMPNINIPVLGLVENMAYFTPAELPENKYYIFGKDGGMKLAERLNIPLLGQIPLVESICSNSDQGTPVALDLESISGKAFSELAEKVAQQIAISNSTAARKPETIS